MRCPELRVKKLSVTRDQNSIFFLVVDPIPFLGLDLIDPRSSLSYDIQIKSIGFNIPGYMSGWVLCCRHYSCPAVVTRTQVDTPDNEQSSPHYITREKLA